MPIPSIQPVYLNNDYVKESTETDNISTNNSVSVENEKKVISLVEHILSNVLDKEPKYTIAKYSYSENNEKHDEDGNYNFSSEHEKNADKMYYYELSYENSDYEKGFEEYVRLTITPELFKIRTNSTTLVKQRSKLFETLETKLCDTHSVYYANKVSNILDDAMTKVGNSRKYTISQYMEEFENDEKATDGKTVTTSVVNRKNYTHAGYVVNSEDEGI